MADNVVLPATGAPVATHNVNGVNYQIIISIDEAINHESDGAYDYYAFSAPGTATSNIAWKVYRIAKVTTGSANIGQKQYADGNSSYDNIGSGMSALSFS